MLTLYKYSDDFPKLFQQEKQELEKIIGTTCQIEHIGSTAIPGVDGKGIIDIMLVFTNQSEINNAVNLLKSAGYVLPEDTIDRGGRVYMSSVNSNNSSLGDIHLHLEHQNSDSCKNAILFRNYLISHPTEKQRYIDLKYQLVDTVNGDRAQYTNLKAEFINKIIKLAKYET